MKLRMIGLSLVLVLSLLTGCGTDDVPQNELPDTSVQQEEVSDTGTQQEEIPDADTQQEDAESVEQESTTEPEADSTEPETDGEAETDSDVQTETVPTQIDAGELMQQLNVIYNGRSDWYNEETVNYTVADLDQNGKLEVLAGSCIGSGMYTYVDIWEVDGETLTKCERLMEEYESQADVIVAETVVYAVDGGWTYMFYDTVREGAMGYTCDLRGVTLRDGAITETTYATLTGRYEGEQEVTEGAMADGTALTEDEFYALKEHLMDSEMRQVSFQWYNGLEDTFDISTASEADALSMLKNLYAGFILS